MCPFIFKEDSVIDPLKLVRVHRQTYHYQGRSKCTYA